ncbi:hypothetical protein [Pleionea sediminis]|uniref:hypothetical protein n=1 Tax=Pleionea sediminis TaxID=2569479 RepID=UPI0011859B88|nr:hypothetical protein [Pleionea sediminis]
MVSRVSALMTLSSVYLSGALLFSNDTSAQESQVYTCENSRSLGYQMEWSGDIRGVASGDRGGHYWAFNGESIIFNMQTPFRKDIGQVWFAHTQTDIEYLPGNQYELALGKKKSSNHGKLQLNDPWFEGVTLEEAGYLKFTMHTMKPVASPCLQGEGEVSFYDEDTKKTVKVKLQFAIDVTGSKFRG